jgi:hypothetical protein
MLPTSSCTSPRRLRRRTSILRRSDGERVRWVKISAHAAASSAPGVGVVAEHDPLLALAMIAPLDTVHAVMAAQAATIRLMP